MKSFSEIIALSHGKNANKHIKKQLKREIQQTNLRINFGCVEKMTGVHIVENSKILATEEIAAGSIVYGGQALLQYWRSTDVGDTGIGLFASLYQLEKEKPEVFKNLLARIDSLYPFTEEQMRTEMKNSYSREIKTAEDLDKFVKQPQYRIIEKLISNHFMDYNDLEERNVFIKGSKFNHSCRPNCIWMMVDGGLIVKTEKNILLGEECTISYWPDLEELKSEDATVRRAAILERAGFLCGCIACSCVKVKNIVSNPSPHTTEKREDMEDTEEKMEEKMEEKKDDMEEKQEEKMDDIEEKKEEKKDGMEEKQEEKGKDIDKSNIKSICHYCRRADTKLLSCGRCKKVQYCSKECQRTDWKNHKIFCEKS